ncbi:CWC16 protein [Pelomyxa schiedti]|nr:CWC16 protein [Pelomyxa schiedti]
MGERKVLNKYYPPDFDPELIPRAKRPKNGQVNVRMMLPMSVRCNVCGEYLYKGKKFNSRKETIYGEDYLGIRIFRFYMKCTRCNAEFTIKTDPKNSDYACEVGVSRNFEPWRATEKAEEEAKQKRQEEEKGDVMKALENRTMDSKEEIDILEALDEMRALNARNAKITSDDVFAIRNERDRAELERLREEDERELADVVFEAQVKTLQEDVADEDGDDVEEKPVKIGSEKPSAPQNPPDTSEDHTGKATTPVDGESRPKFSKPVKAVDPSTTTSSSTTTTTTTPAATPAPVPSAPAAKVLQPQVSSSAAVAELVGMFSVGRKSTNTPQPQTPKLASTLKVVPVKAVPVKKAPVADKPATPAISALSDLFSYTE